MGANHDVVLEHATDSTLRLLLGILAFQSSEAHLSKANKVSFSSVLLCASMTNDSDRRLAGMLQHLQPSVRKGTARLLFCGLDRTKAGCSLTCHGAEMHGEISHLVLGSTFQCICCHLLSRCSHRPFSIRHGHAPWWQLACQQNLGQLGAGHSSFPASCCVCTTRLCWDVCRCCHACSQRSGFCHPPLLPAARLPICTHPHHLCCRL